MNKSFASTVATVATFAIMSALSLPASAQGTTPPVTNETPGQRYDNQQDRIAAGIKNGQLTPAEVSQLEAEQARLKQRAAQLKAQNGGQLTPAEQTRLNNIQNRLSHQIKTDEANGAKTHFGNGVVGTRQQNQQNRIAQGVQSGSLTAGQAAQLENKEAQLNQEVKADRQANGGKLTQAERQQVRGQQNQLSRQINKDKHNNKK